MTSDTDPPVGPDCPEHSSDIPGEDDIVISGMSGRFPNSENISELHENLLNKVDLLSSIKRRWKTEHPELPERLGFINNLDKFDATFFGVNPKQAHAMDPLSRMLLEHAFEAIFDAGVNPRQLQGHKIGVFIASSISETEKTWYYDRSSNGLGVIGCARTMVANRISFCLGVQGPSYALDSACSSSLYAMDNAYRAIKHGQCDAAIIAGGNLNLHPFLTLECMKLGVLSKDGYIRAFDDSANGYVRSEAAVAIFLQQKKNAKRIYATVIHSKTNCDGFKKEGITCPSSRTQSQLLQEFYKECGLPPTIVNYVEAHGTGTRVGDPIELEALDTVFSPCRKEPLKIGSCKSNLGHTEAGSGLCSIVKVLMAMESGTLQPNIHYKNPRKGVKALEDGRLSVVTEPTPWEGGYVGVNSFGFGGANAHVLLKSHSKRKVNNGVPVDDFPRIVAISGRTNEAVSSIIDNLIDKPIDAEFISLLHDIYSEDVKGHLYRGYTLLPSKGVAQNPPIEISSFSGAKRPVWFVFSGVGSQWPGMGEALLQLPVFKEAIDKCNVVLQPHGIDIFNLITNKSPATLDTVLKSFIGIAAIQIGLVDVLRSIGIQPDHVIGHSVGELGCAYADGCLTVEQTILCAYYRGKATMETEIISGSMAAVGLGFKALKDLCPTDITVACHNSSDSATISGPKESIKKFIAELQEKNIFVKEVSCNDTPYHSKYMAPVGPKYLAYLQKIIPDPKARSSKWISTSVPIEKWDTPKANFASAEYHMNNLLHSVLFEESSTLIPKDAITIEIAPCGLLQAILRRSLSPSVTNICLIQRDSNNNIEFILKAIGKMFIAGLQPKLANLYPAVQYPVGLNTPRISPLIMWDHSQNWFIPNYELEEKSSTEDGKVKMFVENIQYEFIRNSEIEDKNLYFVTEYLYLIWKTFAMTQGDLFSETSVVFENVAFSLTKISKESGDYNIVIDKGQFKIIKGKNTVIFGNIRKALNSDQEVFNTESPLNCCEEDLMKSDEMQKLSKISIYRYSGKFSNINIMKMRSITPPGLYFPTSIKKLVVHAYSAASKLDQINNENQENRRLPSTCTEKKNVEQNPLREVYKFTPFIDQESLSLPEISRIVTQLTIETKFRVTMKTIELIEKDDEIIREDLLSPWLSEALNDMPIVHSDVNIVCLKPNFECTTSSSNFNVTNNKNIYQDSTTHLVIGHQLLTKEREHNLRLLLRSLQPRGLLLTREIAEKSNDIEEIAESKGLHVVLRKFFKNEVFILLKKKDNLIRKTLIIKIDNVNLDWINEMQNVMTQELNNEASGSTRIVFVGQGDYNNGLLGFIKCLRREEGGQMVRALLIHDEKAPEFSLQNPIYAKQLEKDLTINILGDNSVWGCYIHFSLAPLEPKAVTHAYVDKDICDNGNRFKWFEGPIQDGSRHKELVEIVYSSINLRDFINTWSDVHNINELTDNLKSMIGFEFCGFHASGMRIMGIVPKQAISNLCIADPNLSWEIPDSWTFADAATVPTAYAMCYYVLYVIGGMKKGDKVFIYSGSSDIGQAAISLALSENCEVFTTVNKLDKRRFLREKFPEITDNHIGNVTDKSFEETVMKLTNGKGVDIIFHYPTSEKIKASAVCLAKTGQYFEVENYNWNKSNCLDIDKVSSEIKFRAVTFDELLRGPDNLKLTIGNYIRTGIKSGVIRPLSRTIFPKDQIREALQSLSNEKHIGKVIIKIREENKLLKDLPLSTPKYHCVENGSYIIFGGLGGFGLALADWMVVRGAKNLVLVSRRGVRTNYQRSRIEYWQSLGVCVLVVSGKNAANPDDCKNIIQAATNLGPVDGIFNLAVVLRDAFWKNQTIKFFEESLSGKAWATDQLDKVSRCLCPTLRYFVVFSSVTSGRGYAGQTNYGMANSAMERICEKRIKDGFPATAIQWGVIADVGIAVDMQKDNPDFVMNGTVPQRIASCLYELDSLLLQKNPVVSCMVVAEKKSSQAEKTSAIDVVMNIIGIKSLSGISNNTPLSELGMDSMMTIDIKNTLESEFNIILSINSILDLNFGKLQELTNSINDQNKDINGNCT